MAFQDKKREWIEIFFFTRSLRGHRVSQWAISKIPPPRNPRWEMQGVSSSPRRAQTAGSVKVPEVQSRSSWR